MYMSCYTMCTCTCTLYKNYHSVRVCVCACIHVLRYLCTCMYMIHVCCICDNVHVDLKTFVRANRCLFRGTLICTIWIGLRTRPATALLLGGRLSLLFHQTRRKQKNLRLELEPGLVLNVKCVRVHIMCSSV